MLIKIKAEIPLLVIPDLIRNLVFTTSVAWVKLDILKQVQDDKVERSEGHFPVLSFRT